MKIKLKDVADKAGVSITTCSLILNNKPINTSEETKKAVLNAARELGYIKKYKVRNIGLIVPDLENLYYTELTKKISAEAQKENYNIVIFDSNNSLKQERNNLNLIRQTDIEGLLLSLIPSEENLPHLQSILRDLTENEHLPIVILDSNYPSLNSHSICVNNYQGGYLATEHLIELGHTKIGCITGDSGYPVYQDRTQGYCSAFTQNQLSFNKDWIYNGKFTMDTGYQATPYLLEQGVTAIFAQNDMIAFGVYHYLKEHGIRVPEDVSLVGFDNIPFIQMIGLPLTTIAQPIQQMAERSIEILLSPTYRQNTSDRITLTLQPELIVRASSAEPSKM